MKTDVIREKYLQFFQSKGHTRCASDVLVPKDDPSVLFTPAGMNQFKDHFLGKVELTFTRATTCQKCFRTGDIDNVGRTAFHHTFFEMLGNFSFGDYFKKEAILWAWEFLTAPQWLGIDPGRLNVTVYLDDDEAAEIWHKEVGLPLHRITRKDEDENFWPASAPSKGPNGVCGPCSEIYYQLDDGGEVEVWNLVFTQFNRVGDPPNNLQPLPSNNIDTGMGLERIASVLQNVPTNYHIDSLFPIVQKAAEICGKTYEYKSDIGRRLRRITDHLRAVTLAIHENVVPSNEKQGYQIRLLLRRAILDGFQLGLREPALYQLVPTIVEQMAQPYPELKGTIGAVQAEIQREELHYHRLLLSAIPFLDRQLQTVVDQGLSNLSGDLAFNWYQTDGIPPELTKQECERFQLEFDQNGYDAAKERHAVASGQGQKDLFQTGPLEDLKAELRSTEFLGYETTECQATIKGIVYSNRRWPEFDQCNTPSEQWVDIVLDRTPFYAESGGQVGDVGCLKSEDVLFEVVDTQKASGLIVHHGVLRRGKLTENLQVTASVDLERRVAVCRAHSATHVLHHALQKNLGADAQQRGSKVEPDRLRFDFKCDAAIATETLSRIQEQVLSSITRNDHVSVGSLPLAEARKAGAMMLFGEKYPEVVRMVSIGDYSKELCGGTHLDAMGELQAFEILSDDSVSAGTRRITALTGKSALEHRMLLATTRTQIAEALGVGRDFVCAGVDSLRDYLKQLKKVCEQGQGDTPIWRKPMDATLADKRPDKLVVQDVMRILNSPLEACLDRVRALLGEANQLTVKIASFSQSEQWSAEALLQLARTVGGSQVIVAETTGCNGNRMRLLIDQVRKTNQSTAILLLAGESAEKVTLVAGLTRDLVEKGLSAGQWVKEIAPIVGGGGGGKADLAQAGGKEPGKIKQAVEAAINFMKSQLAS
ncbi:MAG: alanine--tRNA ligase [Planctomycetaceae bacterium]|nr:alanine--tRNA ligase [Planctomycetaceae bacterium]